MSAFWRVHSVQVVQAFEASGPAGGWLVSSGRVFPPFVRLVALFSVHRLEICLISRFKGVFSVVWGCRVGLFVLRALLGLCGFCTRVELGG